MLALVIALLLAAGARAQEPALAPADAPAAAPIDAPAHYVLDAPPSPPTHLFCEGETLFMLDAGESRSFGNTKPGTVYLPHMQCLWHANHTTGGALRFDISELNLGGIGGDWIFVLDGETQHMSFSGKHCFFNNTELDASECPPVITQSSSMVVFFTSNHKTRGTGFNFTITAL